MAIFSFSIFKKGLQKKLFYPTLISTFFCVLTCGLIDAVIPYKMMGKLAFCLGILTMVSLFNLSVLSSLIKGRFALNAYQIVEKGMIEFQSHGVKGLIFFFISFFLFLAGGSLHLIQSAPYIGAILKVALCIANFAIYLLENLLVIGFSFFLFLIAQSELGIKIGSFKQLLAEAKHTLEHDLDSLLRFFKGFIPLVIAFLFTSNVQEKVLSNEQDSIVFFMNLFLSIPISLILTPFVNYFFLSGLKGNEKVKPFKYTEHQPSSSR